MLSQYEPMGEEVAADTSVHEDGGDEKSEVSLVIYLYFTIMYVFTT